MDTDTTLRKYDLRSTYSEQLREILKEHYSNIPPADQSAEALRMLTVCFSSGVPFDYLEAEWEDYQAKDRAPLQEVRDFAASIPFQIHTGGGLVLIGVNGAGKSFLSYMCALEAIRRWKTATACFSVREYLDKKRYQYLNPNLFDELLHRIDQARFVVIDNLSRESDKLGWKPEDLFEIIDRITTGKRKKCLVLNTNMSKADYESESGGSVLSRTRKFERVLLDNEDFRNRRPDYRDLIKRRKIKVRQPKCYKPLSFLADKKRLNKPEACKRCAYSTRATLCELRSKRNWIKLEEPHGKPEPED